MKHSYHLLKGTVSRLTVFDDQTELRSDNIGLFALIGLTIVGLIGSAAALIGSLTSGGVKLEGQRFCCYVGNKKVEGKLVRAGFNDGDYVEMMVKAQKDNGYIAYAVRVPQQHAFFFPRSVGTPTLELLKYCSIGMGCLCLFSYFIGLLISFFYGDLLDSFITVSLVFLFIFIMCLFILFFMLGGRYSFLSNKIYAIFGYPRPWLFNSLKEESKFKKMNRSNDPELFTDPQTPDFKRVTKFTPFAHYYGRTPALPKWVNVIDERGFTPKA